MTATTKRSTKPAKPRMSFADAMAALQKAGSEQARKTYLRHGAAEPMFGVSFAALKAMHKAIGVDHELALALWDSGNYDARNLAVKIVDPAAMTAKQLDAWARARVYYVADVAAEGPHASSRVEAWLASKDVAQRANGWTLVGVLAQRDEGATDAWLVEKLAEIERSIHAAPNAQRDPMNLALIKIGGRNAALRKAATAAAKRIGKVAIDHGDTACKTADAVESIEKTWARAKATGFDSPAAHERSNKPARLRC